ncbi:MAG: tail fiber domain-containing protein [Akkermansiaceae bacterium]|nr:tail fiber domain-containing protein [Akkermansiaceae bacterium]MCF7730267.1 tail fiber domain-containing protein [Akkermansiaceae bacterium]
MKTPSMPNLTLAAVLLLAMPAFAQVAGPPALIDYQGRVLDSLGEPVAKGTTQNVEMYFRVWDHISAGLRVNLLWAEKQIVTVADGNFSVRLGEGDQILSSAGDNVIPGGNDDPRPALLGVFDGKERFLGVAVAANSIAKPTTEIRPRLAFLTTPFAAVAEKARFAEFGPSGGTFSADQIGIGTTSPSAALHVASTGPLNLLLEADTDNVSEADQPTLTFSQDGGQTKTNLGYFNGSDDFAIQGVLGERWFTIQPDGDVGVGTTNPLASFHLVRPNTEQAKFYATGTSQGGGMFYAGQSPTYGGGFFYEGDATPDVVGNQDRTVFFRRMNGTDSEVLSYHSNSSNVYFTGNIGIGTESPTEAITVADPGSIRLNGGRIRLNGGESDGIQWMGSGEVVAGTIYHDAWKRIWVKSGVGGVYLEENKTSWTTGSDERLKSDLEPLSGILDKIEGIRVVEYNMAAMRVDPKTGKIAYDHSRPPRKMKNGKTIKHEIGTIAQDWLKDFPELVTEPANEDDYYGLAYDRIGVVALGAAKELHHLVKEQAAQLKERDAKIADLEARLGKLEALMSAPR